MLSTNKTEAAEDTNAVKEFDAKGRLLSLAHDLMQELVSQKSLERTERDRLLAIAHTDTQKLLGFIMTWL